MLTKTKAGTPRLTEQLTSQERFKRHRPNHHAYWDLIAAELQCFGANSLSTLLRGGEGVLYREILCDVCDRLKVDYNKKSRIRSIEMSLLMKVLEDSMEKMSEQQLRKVVASLKLKTTKPTKEAIVAALQGGIILGGFSSYTVAVIVANGVLKAVIGRGLSLAGNAALTRSIALFAGPIGWIVTTVWALYDIAGPAYRVTIPACCVVAYLRAKIDNQDKRIKEGGWPMTETVARKTRSQARKGRRK